MRTHVDLFSGIGGFALAARWAGIHTVQFVEIDPFCQKVLNKNFSGVPIHGDIKTFTYANWDRLQEQGAEQQTSGDRQLFQNQPFLLTGGFPCQPFSCAGKRRGKEDDRYLWEEMLRVIKEFKPTWIIGENVNGIRSMEFQDGVSELEGDTAFQEDGNSDYTNVLDGICDSLEAIGYEVQPIIIPACAVNAPHRRYRVWIVGRLRYEYRYNPFDHTDANFRKQLQGQENGPVVHIWEARKKLSRCIVDAPDTCREGLQGGKRGKPHEQRQAAHGSITECNHAWDEPWIEVATRFCRVDDGVSNRVDRLKSLGNAVVPQIVEIIGRVIMEIQEANYEN